MKIQAVIFDMDGVLIDSEHLWQRAEQKLWADRGFEITDTMLSETKGLVSREMGDYWNGRFNAAIKDLDALLEEYDEIMMGYYQSEVALMPGAKEALDRIRDTGLPIGLASNSPVKYFKAAAERFDIQNYFSAFAFAMSDNLPGKPHPEVYIKVAGALGKDPVDCLAIEDSFAGLIAAKAARMKVISMPDHRECGQPRFAAADANIKNLGEITPELLKSLSEL